MFYKVCYRENHCHGEVEVCISFVRELSQPVIEQFQTEGSTLKVQEFLKRTWHVNQFEVDVE